MYCLVQLVFCLTSCLHHRMLLGHEGCLKDIPDKVPQQHSTQDLQHENLLLSWLAVTCMHVHAG